tara:strand:- start:312 stop:455 length:144 start_codon:yes stop_codon:yes gene_type:complete
MDELFSIKKDKKNIKNEKKIKNEMLNFRREKSQIAVSKTKKPRTFFK